MTIPRIAPITVEPRLPNARLWELHRKCIDRTATQAEMDELDLMCRALETGQEIHPNEGEQA